MKFNAGACIIFLKAKCRANPTHIPSTCPSKKRQPFSFHQKANEKEKTLFLRL
jgi:hypothetical protein